MKKSQLSRRIQPLNRLEKIQNKLYSVYGRPRWDSARDGLDPLSELIATVLSQHTSDKNSNRAFQELIKKYPTWEKVKNAKTSQVAGAIRSGGLARIKAKRIQAVLNEIKGKYGKLNLDFLSEWKISKAREELQSLPGVGPKTASCVLLFSLGKPVLPVDTHVHRLSQRLGLIGKKVNADKAQVILEELIEPKDRYAFHISLIRHGRQVCKSFHPRCAGCVILEYCPYGQQRVKL